MICSFNDSNFPLSFCPYMHLMVLIIFSLKTFSCHYGRTSSRTHRLLCNMLVPLQTFWRAHCDRSYSFTTLFPFTEEAQPAEFQAFGMLLSCWARTACAGCQSSLFDIRTRGQQGAAPSVVVAYGGGQRPGGRN